MTPLLFVLLSCVYGSENLLKLKAQGSYSQSDTVEVKVAGGGDITIQYLTLRSLGDLPVLICEFAGIAYTAKYYSKSDFMRIKPNLPLGRVPLLHHGDVVISQSGAIVRHLAAHTNLDGGIQHRAATDMAFETVKELFGSHASIKFNGSALVQFLPDFLESSKTIPHFRDTTNRGEYNSFEQSVVILKTFDDIIARQNTNTQQGGFYGLVTDRVTYADLALFLTLEKEVLTTVPHLLAHLRELGLTHLRSYYMNLQEMTRIRSYVHSDRRMPLIERRDGVVGPDYYYVFGDTEYIKEEL